MDALRRYGLCYLLVGFNILMGGFLTAVERPVGAICISVGRGLALQAAALLAAGGGHCGRQCHLVRAADLRGPVPGDGPGLYDPVLAEKPGPGPDQLIRIPNKYPAGNRLLHRMPAVFWFTKKTTGSAGGKK